MCASIVNTRRLWFPRPVGDFRKLAAIASRLVGLVIISERGYKNMLNVMENASKYTPKKITTHVSPHE